MIIQLLKDKSFKIKRYKHTEMFYAEVKKLWMIFCFTVYLQNHENKNISTTVFSWKFKRIFENHLTNINKKTISMNRRIPIYQQIWTCQWFDGANEPIDTNAKSYNKGAAPSFICDRLLSLSERVGVRFNCVYFNAHTYDDEWRVWLLLSSFVLCRPTVIGQLHSTNSYVTINLCSHISMP